MDTKKSIEFVNSLRRNTFRYHSSIQDCDNADDIKEFNGKINEISYMLDRGDKYERLCNTLRERYGCYYYKHPIDEHVSKMSPIHELLDNLEIEFFGSKSLSRYQRINNIMTKMRYLGIAKNDIINMLIELRDEEEKV